MNGFWNALMSGVEELALAGFESALRTGHSGALLALIVGGVNLLLRRWINARWMTLLWGLVLLRFVLPVAPASPASIHNLLNLPGSAPVASAPSEPAYRDAWSSESSAASGNARATVRPERAEVPDFALSEDAAARPLQDWGACLWLAGLLTVLGHTLVVHWRYTRRIARSASCDDQRCLRIWQSCLRDLRFKLEIPVVVGDDVEQPAVLGVWRPRLLLPTHCLELDDDQLRMIMLHELMHVRCRDVAVNWLLLIVRAVQWWNPLFWLASGRFFNLREQARDAMVLRHLRAGAEQCRAYSELLLTLAGRDHQPGWRVMLPASLLGFLSPKWFQRQDVVYRLRGIATAARQQRPRNRYTGLALALVIVAIGLTDAAEPEPDHQPVYSNGWKRISDGDPADFMVLPHGSRPDSPATDQPATDKWTTSDYDVTAGVEIIRRQVGCQPQDVSRRLEPELWFLADPSRSAASAASAAATAVEKAAKSDEPGGHSESESDVPVRQKESSERPVIVLHASDGRWVIHAAGPDAMHQRIRRTAHAWNRSGLGQVTIETRIATTKSNVMEAIGIAWDRIESIVPPSRADLDDVARNVAAEDVAHSPTASAVSSVEHYAPVMVSVLTEPQTRRFISTAQADARSNIMSAPKVTLFNGQQAGIFSGVQRPFVTGIKRGPDGSLTPAVKIVDEGFQLLLHPELTQDHSEIDLAADLELSSVKEVQNFSTRMLDQEATIQVPSVSRVRVATTARIGNGQTLALCIPPTYDQDHYAWVLLTSRAIDEAE
ncbi:MAG: hypothetical protein J5I93_11390 [Pirellulaceae bacterium]|nr:hypothetical protein [Pirellulaceae bacterium]